ncbi:MAG: hypothetical protein R2705_00495 [Ilumatobacteraceae bacterium]
MLGGGVIDDEIETEVDAPLVQLDGERLEVLARAEGGIDIAVVDDGVAAVVLAVAGRSTRIRWK